MGTTQSMAWTRKSAISCRILGTAGTATVLSFMEIGRFVFKDSEHIEGVGRVWN